MTPASLADVIANRASISLARSQRLTSSWLPRTSESQTETNQEEEDAHVFTPEPELLGLGYSLSKDGLDKGQEDSFSLQDKELRKRILGKRKRQDPVTSTNEHRGASKPLPSSRKSKANEEHDEDSEDELGRSVLGKARRTARGLGNKNIATNRNGRITMTAEEEEATEKIASPTGAFTLSGKPNTFLDQVIAEQAQKRKGKKRKKKKRRAQ